MDAASEGVARTTTHASRDRRWPGKTTVSSLAWYLFLVQDSRPEVPGDLSVPAWYHIVVSQDKGTPI